MGFIDFVKNAGAKIFGKGEEEKPQADPKIEARRRVEASRRAAEVLTRRVTDLGLEIDDLRVEVVGDVAVVTGTTANQADREKAILAIGNTHGIARVDDRLEVRTPEPEAVYYTVQSGDSLSKIAKAHYGNAMKYPVIFEANRPMLSDPDKIYPGQMLRIPPLEDK